MTRRRARLRRHLLAGATLVALGLALAGCSSSGEGSAGALVGSESPSTSDGATGAVALPDLELPGLGDDPAVTLSALRGPAVVNVWASWCPPCRGELPALAEVAGQAGDRVDFLGVAVLDRPAAAADAVQAFGIPYPNVLDAQGKTRGGLRWAGPPMTYLVDGEGRVVHVVVGPVADAAELRGLIATHLGVDVG